MPYQYQSLPIVDSPDDMFIRLLELHQPPRKHPPISGELTIFRLSEAPRFSTVSYCWGSTLRAGTIHITNAAPPRDLENGNTLDIPTALIPFLKQARKGTKGRKLWIDSICLDQQNDQEKSAHVPKMRLIYMKAELTISWLGAEYDQSTDAIAYARRLNKWYIDNHSDPQPLSGEKQQNAKVDFQVKVGDRSLEALLRLLERPYFDRTWIVQEIVVSREVYLMCGDQIIHWAFLVNAIVCLRTLHIWVFEFYDGRRLHGPISLRISEMEWQNPDAIDWTKTLVRHRSCLAHDPRDKVFAFYGLRCQRSFEDLEIVPNYVSTTATTLYHTLAARALYKSQVAVLHVPRFIMSPVKHPQNTGDFNVFDLPSWAPDWRNAEETPMSLVGLAEITSVTTQVHTYKASKQSKLAMAFDRIDWNVTGKRCSDLSDLPKLIRLSGVKVARVTQLTRRPWEIPESSRRPTQKERAQVLRSNQQQVYEWETVFRDPDASNVATLDGETATDAMYETFMAGSAMWPTQEKRADAIGFEKRQRFLRVLRYLGVHRVLFIYLLILLAERCARSFGYRNPEMSFRSKVLYMANRKGARVTGEAGAVKEYFALVPSMCALDDHVVLAAGVATPLILREKSGGSVQTSDDSKIVEKRVETWELIGEAYIHGMMNGELWVHDQARLEAFWIA
ncbi:hypothetical protein ACN47E_000786 [Coniothyrium glycines]